MKTDLERLNEAADREDWPAVYSMIERNQSLFLTVLSHARPEDQALLWRSFKSGELKLALSASQKKPGFFNRLWT